MENIPGFIYVIHLERKLCHSRHYIGWAEDVAKRLKRHDSGQGSSFMRAVKLNKIPYIVAAILPGTRNDERSMKNQRNGKRFCPICQEEGFVFGPEFKLRFPKP